MTCRARLRPGFLEILWKRCTWNHELGRHDRGPLFIVWSGNPVVTGKKACSIHDGLEKLLQLMDEKDRIDHFRFKYT